jgi:hypothetical protein
MTPTTRRIIFGATLGLVVVTAGFATASSLPYQAVCEHPTCRWAGTPQVDLRQAILEARYHGVRTGHSVWIKGLLRNSPPHTVAKVVYLRGTVGDTGQVSEASLSHAMAQVGWPAHVTYRFEAYRRGQMVGSTSWETDAASPGQLQALMANAQAGWGQQLKDRGIDWDRISPILIGVRPL